MDPNINDGRPGRNADFASAPKTSLIAELLEIQKHQQSAEECQRWANDLTCLLYKPSTPTCFRKIINSRKYRRQFVAVSWTCQPSSHEDGRENGYTVFTPCQRQDGSPEGSVEPLDMRDSVPDRLVKYLRAFNENLFWVDKACIAQHDSAEKARAINSMDLVYKEAKRSVGLLSSPIRAKSDADLLASLLDGQLSEKYSTRKFCFKKRVDKKTIRETVRVLRSVIGDRWWSRAWIYQEEYLSGTRMSLLIPVAAGVRVPEGYGKVRGEFCVQATKFREQATKFLLACSPSNHQSASKHQRLCFKLLKRVEKYNITLKRNKGSLKPMSPSIFGNIQKRDISHEWDTLAITANACGYRRRLNTELLKDQNRRLSHCLLALFLLNGEIFSGGHRHDMSLLDDDIRGFLDQIQPTFSDLPVRKGGLTFLKYCRLPFVELCDDGVMTKGYIWELPEHATIDTADYDLPEFSKISSGKSEQLKEEPSSSWELHMLADELDNRNHTHLAGKLREYLHRRDDSPAADYKDLMACKLMHAINDGQTLRLAFLPGTKYASGVFIPPKSARSESMHVLTTWQPPRKQDEDQTGLAVSVKVNMRSRSSTVVANISEWINGLVFFTVEENRKKKIVIEWPQSWRCQS